MRDRNATLSDRGAAVLDAAGLIARVDEGFVALAGAPPERLYGRPLDDAFDLVRIDSGRPPLGHPWVAQARPRAERHRWLRMAGTVLTSGDGVIRVVATDVTDDRRNEIYRSVSVQLSQLLAEGIRQGTEDRIGAALRDALPLDRLRLVRLDGVTNHAVVMFTSPSSPSSPSQPSIGVGFGPSSLVSGDDLQSEIPWNETLVGLLGAEGRPVTVKDLTAVEAHTIEAARLVDQGYRSLLAVPLVLARRVAGALIIDRYDPGEFADAEVALVSDLAPLFTAALDRLRLERAAVDSTSLYATVFETAGEGILLSDIGTGRIQAVNTRYLELLGLSRRRLLDHYAIYDLEPETPRDPQARAQMVREQPGPVMTHHRRRSGKQIPVEVTRRMFTWRGRASELTVVRDVRERLKADRQIRQLAAAVDAVSLGVLLTDGEGTVVFVNPALESMLGAHPGSLLGKKVESLRGIDTHGAFEDEVEIVRGDGTRFPAQISRALFDTREGETGGAVEIWSDLSEQKTRDAQLVQADKLASLGQLAASVAHEINNPLAFVIANLHSLVSYNSELRATLDELRARIDEGKELDDLKASLNDLISQRGLLEVITDIDELTLESLRGGERVRTIVADLRAYARRSEVMQVCDLAKVAESALALARNELRYRADVITDYQPGIPDVIGSPGRLEQVLLNLIINAAQSLPKEPPPDRPNKVWLRIYSSGSEVVFEVEDTGCGIPDEVRPHIFKRFYSTKDTRRGTGLGLFISKEIVEQHGGRIDVESQVGKGSKFLVRLPREPEHDPGSPPSEPAREAKRLKVLLIDDEDMVLESLARVLSPHHDVTVALGGVVGLAQAERGHFDVILCDLTMSDLAGDEVYARLREKVPEAAKRFVIMSGGAISPETSNLGEEDVPRILKPIAPEKLLALVARIGGITHDKKQAVA